MMNRRVLLAGLAASVSTRPAVAQSFGFRAAADYSAARRGVSLLVMQSGRIIFEDYPHAGGVERGWELASGTKSFTSIIAAAAVQDRMLALDERAADTLPEWRADPRKNRITIRHLLSLTSGLRAGGMGRPPSYRAAIDTPSLYEPGVRFEYGPTPFQVFGEIMRRKLQGDPAAYLQRRVLDPIGVAPTTWRRGVDGMPLMPQGAALTARAWARFGQFVLEGGRGLIDAEALRQAFLPSAANPGYGLSWWLLRPGLVPPTPRAGVEITAAAAARLGDVRMAAGAGDQRLYLFPERGLVVARQADQILRGMFARGDARWSDGEFLRALLQA